MQSATTYTSAYPGALLFWPFHRRRSRQVVANHIRLREESDRKRDSTRFFYLQCTMHDMLLFAVNQYNVTKTQNTVDLSTLGESLPRRRKLMTWLKSPPCSPSPVRCLRIGLAGKANENEQQAITRIKKKRNANPQHRYVHASYHRRE